MKVYTYLLILLGTFNCLVAKETEEYQAFKKSGVIMQINKKSSSILEQRHAIQCCGYDGQFMHGISLLGITFTTLKITSKNRARAMLINCAEEHLKNINKNQEIKKFLIPSPAQIENVTIRIMFDAIDCRSPTNEMFAASIKNNTLMYFYSGHKETETETLEEAKKILAIQSITQI